MIWLSKEEARVKLFIQIISNYAANDYCWKKYMQGNREEFSKAVTYIIFKNYKLFSFLNNFFSLRIDRSLK